MHQNTTWDFTCRVAWWRILKLLSSGMWRSVSANVLRRRRYDVLPGSRCYPTAQYYTPKARSVCILPFLCLRCLTTVLEVTWVRERRRRRRKVWPTCFRRRRKCNDTQPLCAARRVVCLNLVVCPWTGPFTTIVTRCLRHHFSMAISRNVSRCYCYASPKCTVRTTRLHINYNVSRNQPRTTNSNASRNVVRTSNSIVSRNQPRTTNSNASRDVVRTSNSIVSRILPVHQLKLRDL